jgi:hypothetical protein
MIDMACLRFRRNIGICSVTLVALLSFAPTVSTTTVLPLTFDELLAEAATIVRGEVVDVRSDWRDRQPGSGPIVTFVPFACSKR